MTATGRAAGQPRAVRAGARVCVAGLGVSGVSAARALLGIGAQVTVVDGGDSDLLRERAAELERAGAAVRLGEARLVPPRCELIVTSPGWQPGSSLFAAAAEAGIPVWGDIELAWKLRGQAAPWLAVTGTNGKTTTVRMLAGILGAAGWRTAAVGNVGTPVLDAVLADEHGANPYDVLAVELSSYQLHWAPSPRPHSAAVLNVAQDHLDWHGSMAAYAADKGRIYHGNLGARVYNCADPVTERLARERPSACRTVGFTLGRPGPAELGVVDGVLLDRVFGDSSDGEELAKVSDVQPAAPHNIANALAAAALARAFGVPATAVRDGLRAFRPDAHRMTQIGSVAGVAYVDDSKATNPHATAASLAAYENVVWIAGGLAKGATFGDLVAAIASRLRGVVLLGVDRELIREALTRHAPDVPVVDLARTDTGAMAAAVQAAARLARPGDTVVLAPACASMDMFVNYGKRGDAFAAAVAELGGG